VKIYETVRKKNKLWLCKAAPVDL